MNKGKGRIMNAVECSCKDWKPGMEKINGPITLQQARTGRSFRKDYFIPMKYCPWCGKGLTQEVAND